MGGSWTAAPSPGWYGDPSGRAELRFWTGQEWSRWVWDGTTVAADLRPVRLPLNGADVAHLEFVDRVFLPEARALGMQAPSDDDGLEELVRRLAAEANGVIPRWSGVAPTTSIREAAAAPAQSQQTSPAAPPTPAAQIPTTETTRQAAPDSARPSEWTPATAQSAPTAPPAAPAPPAPTPPTVPAYPPVAYGIRPTGAPPAMGQTRQPATEPVRRSQGSAFARWWARSRQAVGSDLAVHGLAYLGVLLFFVGVFGLVVFAFGDVTPGLRPLAELVIALAPFVAGAMLLRRQAITAGRALEALGGALLPIMVATTLLDDVPFPPDLHGMVLVLVLTALTGFIAASYAWWSMRHESSALRYLVAPMVWLTVAVASLGLARAVPVGKAAATPSAAQVAAIAAALVVTLVWARSRPQTGLARPTVSVAGPGLLVVALLAVLTWEAEGWPTVPVLTCGALVLTALELLRHRLPAALPGLAEPLWWALVWAALVSGVGTAPAGTAAAVGFVLITELAAAALRPVWALALPAMGAAAALASTWSDARWATVAFTATAVWALGRRLKPYALPRAAVILDWVAGVLPAFALAALATASDAPTAVAAGTGAVLLATLPAKRFLLRRDLNDTFWTQWWRSAVAVVALAAVVIGPDTVITSQQWLVTVSLIMLAIASTVGPIPSVWRPWLVVTLATAAWLDACATLDAGDMVRTGALALAGLSLVAVAHIERWGWRRDLDASMGLAGHLLGVAAVLFASHDRSSLAVAGGTPTAGWSLVLTVGLATAGWTLTAVMDSRDQSRLSPVGEALRRLGGWAVWLPVGLAALGLPLTVALVLDTAGVLGFGDPWAMLVPALTAVAYAAATRLRLPERIGATAGWGAFTAGILSTTLAAQRLPEAVAFAALVVSVAVLRPQRRAPVMTWVGWAALTPLAGLLAAQWWPWFDAQPGQSAVVLTLLTLGTVLVVGASAFDLRGRSWTPRYVPAHASTVAPFVIGGAELVAALALAYLAVPAELAGWASAGAAAAILATALLTRAGALSGVAIILGWAAVVLLAGPQINAHPWIPVAVALVLLVAAHLVSLLQITDDTETGPEAGTGPRWWVRWDLPLLVSAAPVAITALVAAASGDHWGATFILVGLECLAVTARLRRIPAVSVPVGAIGTALMLLGAGDTGEGWLALALLGVATALTALAANAGGSARLALQIGGAVAALASWQVATAWLGWTLQQSADVTTLGAGLLAVAASVTARIDRIDRIERSWLLVWGGMAVAVAALVAGYTEMISGVGAGDAEASWPVAAGLLLTAAALLAGAEPLALPWLRGLGMAFGVVSVVESLQAGHAGSATQVAVLAMLSSLSAVLSLSLFVHKQARAWQSPLLALGVALSLGALAAALPSASINGLLLLVPGLAASALQAAAVGLVLRNTVAQMLSPVLACASWLVLSSEAFGDNPQWITVPIGLAILTVVELWRLDRSQHGGNVAATEIVVLELTGVAFLVSASFVQTVTEAVGYAVLAAALGLAVMGWGVLTKVRRRLAAGAAVVLVSLVMLVAVPLVGLLPAWQGAALWVLIAGVGLLALLVASFLEQGKRAVHKGLSQFGEATAGWE